MKRAIIYIICACLFCACKTPKIVTVTKVERVHDTVRSLKIDSVYHSRYVYLKGDTVFLKDTVWKFQRMSDTVRVYKRDSIPYEVPVEIPVRVRNGYDRFTSWGFWIFVFLIVLRLAWWAFKKYYLRI